MADSVGKWTVEGLTKIKSAIINEEEISITHFALAGHASLGSVVDFSADEALAEATFPNEVYRAAIEYSFVDDAGLLTVKAEIDADVTDSFFCNGIGLIYEDDMGYQYLMAVGELPLQEHAEGVFQGFEFKLPLVNDVSEAITVSFDPTDRVTEAELSAAIGAHDESAGAHEVQRNGAGGALAWAIDAAGMANREVERIKRVVLQEGQVTIINRGVINGCAVAASVTATRNIDLGGGKFFTGGRMSGVADMGNCAAVPANDGAEAGVVKVYLWVDESGDVQCDCTVLDGDVPDGAIELYSLSVPAGSNETSDPYLASVTFTDARRLEPGWPILLESPAFVSVPLAYVLPDSDYAVHSEVVSAEGGRQQVGDLFVEDRLKNGFKLYLAGGADSVVVRYTVRRLGI